ncbi:MAG: cytochrome ubiquinol oxidase subunit I [Coriobacteriia bacterium]|nr:cytochrome ubiquinol oxidase subunit I [Coriobacteriia bacterium]
MDILSDALMLSRLQFALVIIFHFLFVPLSIGLGLITALMETRHYRSGDPKDKAATHFWAKIFTTTFAIGVATGITMEFSFGTNWADYARYVGDIFGAPLAAEALLAFFLESVFLGIVLFGRKKVSKKFYLASTWLVFGGAALSALWILIANSWMQTPAGFEIAADGSRAILNNFWAAAFNPSTVPRYLHTVDSLLILGSFCAMAVGAWYLKKGINIEHGKRFVKTGLIVGIVTVVLMLPFAHLQATAVAEEQPSKLAAMEGQYQDGAVPLSLFGWVDDATQTTHTFISIPGGTSFLASWNFNTPYPGLNTLKHAVTSFAAYDGVKLQSYQGGTPPVNLTFQAYHLMVALYFLLIVWLILAGVGLKKANKGKINKVLFGFVVFGPLIPFLCIQSGWLVAEVGRQPWVVYNLLLTADGVSPIVSSPELIITILLFIIFYVILFIAWLRIVLGLIKRGPEAAVPASASDEPVLIAASADPVVMPINEAPDTKTPDDNEPKGGE